MSEPMARACARAPDGRPRPPGRLLLIEIDWEVAAHLAAALDAHLGRCEHAPRRIPVPQGIRDFHGLLAARSGQERPGGRSMLAAAGMLSLAEAASRLGVSPRTVRRRVAAGELRGVRVGRLVRIAEAELADYIRRNGNEGAT